MKSEINFNHSTHTRVRLIFFYVFLACNLSAQTDTVTTTYGNNINWIEASKYKLWDNGLLIAVRNGDGRRDTLSLRNIITGADKITYFIDQNQDTVNYKTFQNKVTLLDFWFLRCKPCISELPGLNLIAKHLPSEGFELITFANDPLPEIELKLLSKANFTFRIIPNTFIVRSSYPYKLILSKDHQFVDSQVGGNINPDAPKLLRDKYLPLIRAEMKKIKSSTN